MTADELQQRWPAMFVHGVPAPQGSKSAYQAKGRIVIVEGSSKAGRIAHRQWRTAVTLAAINWVNELGVHFVMPRPKSAPKKAKWAHRKPDLDKLLRCTLDGLADAGVFRDDAQVVQLFSTKVLADNGVTGAWIALAPLS
jgi:crossover junction endodeoxyribonuclease RusA